MPDTNSFLAAAAKLALGKFWSRFEQAKTNKCMETVSKEVYGRSDNWNDKQREAYRILNAAYNQLSILTYDHLLMRAKNVLGVIDNYIDEEDGELPF